MINWLITMFTEWLMVAYYFYSFPNTNIRNPYNVFRLDIFLFLSFDNISQSRYHTRRQSFLGATQNRPLLILIRYSSVDSTEQTNPEKCNRHTQQIINFATQLAVKELFNSKCFVRFINTSSNIWLQVFHTLSSWRNNNHDCAYLEIPTKFILKQQHAEMYKVSHLAKHMVVFTLRMFLRYLTTIK